MPNMKKKPVFGGKEKPKNNEFEETLNKLKIHWPESAINLYLAKAISLHDLDEWAQEPQMTEINKLVLNVDDWHRKNPEYLYLMCTKTLKEKENVPTSNVLSSPVVEDDYQSPFRGYRSRSRYELASEMDSYTNRLGDVSDDVFLDEISRPSNPMEESRPIARSMNDTVMATSGSASWNMMFGDTNNDPGIARPWTPESDTPDVAPAPNMRISDPNPANGERISYDINTFESYGAVDAEGHTYILDLSTGSWIRN